MKLFFRPYLLFILLGVSYQNLAQSLDSLSNVPFYYKITLNIENDTIITFQKPIKFSSYIINVKNKITDGILCSEEFFSQEIPCQFTKNIKDQLVILPNEIIIKSFEVKGFKGLLELSFFYAPALSINGAHKLMKNAEFCEKPQWIGAKEWREGLPEPTKGREETDVHHLIVHHSFVVSADPVQQIRNIYLYHTQDNGWDDIGYNFLIDDKGIIYQGRDNENIEETDNVRGAHFCGKNSNTMGICLLGDFTNNTPTFDALKSLEHLLTWKSYKENIDPKDFTPHPNNSSPLLENIAGHRDGCNTLCPGQALYRQLPGMRINVEQNLNKCTPSSISLDLNPELKIYPNPTYGNISISIPNTILNENNAILEIYAINGQLIDVMNLYIPEINYQFKESGIYIVKLLGSSRSYHQKVIVL